MHKYATFVFATSVGVNQEAKIASVSYKPTPTFWGGNATKSQTYQMIISIS